MNYAGKILCFHTIGYVLLIRNNLTFRNIGSDTLLRLTIEKIIFLKIQDDLLEHFLLSRSNPANFCHRRRRAVYRHWCEIHNLCEMFVDPHTCIFNKERVYCLFTIYSGFILTTGRYNSLVSTCRLAVNNSKL